MHEVTYTRQRVRMVLSQLFITPRQRPPVLQPPRTFLDAAPSLSEGVFRG